MTLELDKATLQTFEPHVGSSFSVRAEGISTTATLDSTASLGHGSPTRPQAFSLYFRVESPSVLPQQIFELVHDTLGAFSLFLVPINEPGKGVLYEAVFN